MSASEHSTTIWEDEAELKTLVAQTEHLLNSPEAVKAAKDEKVLAKRKPAKKDVRAVDVLQETARVLFVPFYYWYAGAASIVKLGKAIGNKISHEKAQNRIIPYYQKLTVQYALLYEKQQKFIERLRKEHNLREDERMALMNQNELTASILERLSQHIRNTAPTKNTEEG